MAETDVAVEHERIGDRRAQSAALRDQRHRAGEKAGRDCRREQRRFAVHQRGKGARFFHTSPALALVYVEACEGKGAALSRERAIKRLGKPAKEWLVAQWAEAALG